MSKKQKKILIRILCAAVLLIFISLLPPSRYRAFLYLIPYLIIGYDILRKAWRGILNRQVFDENFLMAIATIGAMVLGEYPEGVAVMLFYQIGELFQSYAVGKSRKNISELMDIRPDYANIETDDGLETVAPDDVPIGSVIVVNPGDKVPIDGIIVSGSSSLDTCALTGESQPTDVLPGDSVLSGSINISGVLRIETTEEFGNSTASKILELVENASSHKSRSENFITKFARYYTPAVCCGALAVALLPPLLRMSVLNTPPAWSIWIYRALTFLVISCPCALVISIPLSFFAGIGCASKSGILIKGSNYLETLSQVKTLVLDKTGTLTRGNFVVTGIHHSIMEDEKLLELAALAEAHSRHPISKSLQSAYGIQPDINRVQDVQEISGKGILATVDGASVAVGNAALMRLFHIPFKNCRSIGTVIHVAVDGSYAGHILISDEMKPQSEDAIRQLNKLGVQKTIMLTGDTEPVARAVADKLGITDVHAELLPADKVALVESLLASSSKTSKVAFAGDGINDAPVLSRADVGIAMGALGTDAAIEAADIVLMDDNPVKIATAIRIARRCIRIVYENIVFAIGIKVVCLILGAAGLANMWLAIFADVGVMILAVLNAIRALFIPHSQQ